MMIEILIKKIMEANVTIHYVKKKIARVNLHNLYIFFIKILQMC